MSDKTKNSNQALDLSVLQLHLEFVRRGDRFVQVVSLEGCPILHSVEGGDAEIWPPSPPLQQLLAQTTHRGPALLGVGSSGTTHWSHSVEAVLIRNELVWDLAARIHSQANLRSSFTLSAGVSVLEFDPQLSLKLEISDSIRNVSIVPDPATTRLEYDSKNREVIIQPTKNPQSLPNTVRWKFAIQLN